MQMLIKFGVCIYIKNSTAQTSFEEKTSIKDSNARESMFLYICVYSLSINITNITKKYDSIY